MQNGGCHPVDGCQDGDGFAGAVFQYLAANVFYAGTDQTILPPYEIKKIDNAKIAFIGLTLEGTPTIVTPSAVAGLEFRPEVATVNALVEKLRNEQGVKAFVVLLHQGGFQNPPARSRVARTGESGRLHGRQQVRQLRRRRDHVDRQRPRPARQGRDQRAHACSRTSARSRGKLVTSAASFGRLITDIDLRIDHQSKDRQVGRGEERHRDAGRRRRIRRRRRSSTSTRSSRRRSRTGSIGTITADIRSGRDTPTGRTRRRAADGRRDRRRACSRRPPRPTSAARWRRS